jgi:hypothetical protein
MSFRIRWKKFRNVIPNRAEGPVRNLLFVGAAPPVGVSQMRNVPSVLVSPDLVPASKTCVIMVEAVTVE